MSEKDLPKRIVGLRYKRYHVPPEDLISEGRVGLWKAALTFDPTKGASFRTFAKLCVESQIKSALRVAGHKIECRTKTCVWQPWMQGGNYTVQEAEAHEVYDKIMAEPLLRLRAQGLSWQEVAKHTGLSMSFASTKGAKLLRELRSDCG